MFESAEVGSKIDKDEYDRIVPQLRVDLINAQYDLQHADSPVIVLIDGDDRPGCAEIVDLMNEWMDPRGITTHFFGRATEEERQRPTFWRYWRALPPAGRMGVFLRSWIQHAIGARARGTLSADEFDRVLSHVHQFEGDLADEGALIVKFWIHVAHKELKKRLKAAKKGPRKGWRFDKQDRMIQKSYDRVMPLVERAIRKTSTTSAVWNIVEGTDERYRNLAVMQTLLDAVTSHMVERADRAAGPVNTESAKDTTVVLGKGALDGVDLTATIAHPDYRKRLDKLQARLSQLSRRAMRKGVSSVLVFEGWDAAGKGGVIRRITRAMTAESYRVIPIAAPTDEEKAHHYLWRFWRKLPRAGRTVIFDRSWYGRVMVERIEGFARPDQWERAYEEINDFEEQLVGFGIPVLKFWLHIDPDEQLSRFKAREKTPYKKYKITDEDYRNRERWDDYVIAVNEMVDRTSTDIAPWSLVSANDKRWARLEVLETVCKGIKRAVKTR